MFGFGALLQVMYGERTFELMLVKQCVSGPKSHGFLDIFTLCNDGRRSEQYTGMYLQFSHLYKLFVPVHYFLSCIWTAVSLFIIDVFAPIGCTSGSLRLPDAISISPSANFRR